MEADESGPGIWRQRWQVRSYDVDFRKRVSAEAICRAFLDVAWNHAEQLGFGYEHLARQGLFWVLVRLLVQIDSYPLWGDAVELRTWPRGTNGAFALRDFELVDSAGKQLVGGASSWLVLDAKNRRPQRIDKLLFHVPRNITRMGAGREPGKLPGLKPGPASLAAQARYTDIDVNEHVNSARYVTWLLDSYPPAFHRAHTLRRLELNYVAETKWGDALSVVSEEKNPLEFSHCIFSANQTELCRAELVWAAETI